VLFFYFFLFSISALEKKSSWPLTVAKTGCVDGCVQAILVAGFRTCSWKSLLTVNLEAKRTTFSTKRILPKN